MTSYETYIDIAQVTVGHAIDAPDCPDFHRAPLRIVREQLDALYGAAVSNRGAQQIAETPEGGIVWVRTSSGVVEEARIGARHLFVALPPFTRRECEAAYAAFDQVLRDWPNAVLSGMTESEEDAFKRNIVVWNSLRTAFGEGIANHRDVSSVYLWENGVVMVFDFVGEQIGELQGPRTDELEERIRARATGATEWHGFPPDEPCVWGTAPD